MYIYIYNKFIIEIIERFSLLGEFIIRGSTVVDIMIVGRFWGKNFQISLGNKNNCGLLFPPYKWSNTHKSWRKPFICSWPSNHK